jgi:hypothetical protein
MSPTDYAAVLSAIRPDSLWGMTDNDYATLVWVSDDPKPTKKMLDDAWPEVESDRKWAGVRAERDRRLAACDWTQVADAPLTAGEKQAWAAYRQELRDIPQTQDDPDNIVWPEAP